MADISILHLSDIHFSTSNKEDIKIVFAALYNEIDRIASIRGFFPNHVIISGDIVKSGDAGFSVPVNDYANANELLFPLLEKIKINTDNLYICPGNHDIQKSLIEEFSEFGAKQKFLNKAKVNDFIDTNPTIENPLIKRMSNFEKYFSQISNRTIIHHDIFSTVYKEKINNKILGIAAFNSAWRSIGEKDDYGKLIIADRVFNNVKDTLSDCDFKIGFAHHPFSCLTEFNQIALERLVPTVFNLWLTGHYHDFCGDPIANCHNGTLYLSGGALYNSREYFNGFEIINISIDPFSCEYIRSEYDDRDQRFYPCHSDFAVNGFTSFNFPVNVHQVEIDLINNLETLKQNLLPTFNSGLLKTGASEIQFDDFFVVPTIYSESESKIHSLENENIDISNYEISLENILNKNSLIIGKKESGKTTLLYFLMEKILNCTTASELTFPLYVDFKHLPQGKNRIEKGILFFLEEYQINLVINDLLDNKKWTLFIDNFNFQDTKSVLVINEFMTKHPNGKIIMSIDEALSDQFLMGKVETINVDFQKCYIQSFNRKEIRLLTENWLKDNHTDFQPGDIADVILKRMSDINLPFTPLIVSMMLISIEEKQDYFPINKASLVENIIELILEKTNPSEKYPGGIDFRILEDLLCKFAHLLDDNGEKFIDEMDFLKFVNEYFQKRSQTIVGGINRFYQFIINKGIIININGMIGFKFTCFKEYFLAKLMTYDNAFYEKAVTSENLLNFSGPLEYLAGLQRNNYGLLNIISSYVNVAFDSFCEEKKIQKYLLTEYDDISEISDTFPNATEEDRKKEIDNIQAGKLSEKEKDQLSKTTYQISSQNDKKPSSNKNNNDTKLSLLLQGLSLYAHVLKNCELIDDEKQKIFWLNECQNIYFQCVFFFLDELTKKIEQMDFSQFKSWIASNYSEIDLSSIKEENFPQLKSLIISMNRVNFLFIFQTFFCSEIETPKINNIASALFLNEELAYIERLTCLKIMLDTKMPGYVEKIEHILKTTFKSLFKSFLFSLVLHFHYMISSMRREDQTKIESILADLICFTKNIEKSEKSKVIQKLSRDKLTDNLS